MLTNTRTRVLIVFMAIFFGGALGVVSLVPMNRIELGTRADYFSTPAAKERANAMHVGVHIVGFGALAGVAWLAAECAAGLLVPNVAAKLIAVALTVLLGWGTEYMQHIVYRNTLEWNDICTNLASSFVVLGLIALVSHFRKVRAQRPVATVR